MISIIFKNGFSISVSDEMDELHIQNLSPDFFSLISGGFSSLWPSVRRSPYDEIFDQTEKVLVKKAIHHFKD